MAAVQPLLYAESLREPKKRSEPFRLEEFTITGMIEQAEREEREKRKKKAADPGVLWAKIGAMMQVFGGK